MAPSDDSEREIGYVDDQQVGDEISAVDLEVDRPSAEMTSTQIQQRDARQ